MPTTLPAPIVARQPYGLFRTLGIVATLMAGRFLFSASTWCVEVANCLARRD